jgi:hypothetical protein
MTRDDIIRMAFEASGGVLSYDAEGRWILSEQEVIRLAALVAAAEREACAEMCEGIARDIYGMENLREYGECAAAIRARGATECEGMRWEHTAVVWTAPQSERGEK